MEEGTRLATLPSGMRNEGGGKKDRECRLFSSHPSLFCMDFLKYLRL